MKRRATGKTAAAVPGNARKGNDSDSAVSTSTTNNLEVQKGPRLGPDFYRQSCIDLSKGLLGKVLVRRFPDGTFARGTIVESEAYPGASDKASYSFDGKKTAANEGMYMEPGTIHVHLTYGMYHILNISSEGEGSACLIRAVEPKEGSFDLILQLRSRKVRKVGDDQQSVETQVTGKPKFKLAELCNGPGKLCMGFDIRKDFDKLDLNTSLDLWLESNEESKFLDGGFEIQEAPRVGIDRAPEESRSKLWRFYIKDNASVSVSKVKSTNQKGASASRGKRKKKVVTKAKK